MSGRRVESEKPIRRHGAWKRVRRHAGTRNRRSARRAPTVPPRSTSGRGANIAAERNLDMEHRLEVERSQRTGSNEPTILDAGGSIHPRIATRDERSSHESSERTREALSSRDCRTRRPSCFALTGTALSLIVATLGSAPATSADDAPTCVGIRREPAGTQGPVDDGTPRRVCRAVISDLHADATARPLRRPLTGIRATTRPCPSPWHPGT